jgi:aryl-alcohol dehydrogenase-like predicted oxidoreductase
MGMSEFYGPADPAEVARALDRALELGMDFLDTADMYGSGANEELLRRLLGGRRGAVTLATKFGIVRDPENPAARHLNARPD